MSSNYRRSRSNQRVQNTYSGPDFSTTVLQSNATKSRYGTLQFSKSFNDCVPMDALQTFTLQEIYQIIGTAKHQYEQLIQYVCQGRPEREQMVRSLQLQVSALQKRCEQSHFYNRRELETVIADLEKQIVNTNKQLVDLDSQIPVELSRIREWIRTAYEANYSGLHEIARFQQWPTPSICAELQLPMDLVTGTQVSSL